MSHRAVKWLYKIFIEIHMEGTMYQRFSHEPYLWLRNFDMFEKTVLSMNNALSSVQVYSALQSASNANEYA